MRAWFVGRDGDSIDSDLCLKCTGLQADYALKSGTIHRSLFRRRYAGAQRSCRAARRTLLKNPIAEGDTDATGICTLAVPAAGALCSGVVGDAWGTRLSGRWTFPVKEWHRKMTRPRCRAMKAKTPVSRFLKLGVGNRHYLFVGYGSIYWPKGNERATFREAGGDRSFGRLTPPR